MQAFNNPVRIEFGAKALDGLPDAVGGRDCILITSPGMAGRDALGRMEAALGDRIAATFNDVLPNPTIASCTNAFEALEGVEAGLLVALGGGSVIDTAKALAAQRAQRPGSGWLAGHLRDGLPFPQPFVPPAIIAIPTTAGTGSEVTMWATIWDDVSATKRSISHPSLYPEAALLDPVADAQRPADDDGADRLRRTLACDGGHLEPGGKPGLGRAGHEGDPPHPARPATRPEGAGRCRCPRGD